MAKSVQLPFCVPTFATTQGAAAPGLAIAGHPTAYNQILNQCISVQCKSRFLKGGFSSPEITIQDVYIGNFSCLIKNTVQLKYTYSFFLDIVKNMLDDGNYVFFNSIDDYYLPGKSWYGIRHMHHNGTICGYDDLDGTFSIAAYDINWVFNLIRIPQKCVVEGLLSSIDAGEVGTLWAYKVTPNEVLLDQKKILSRLKEYLDSDFEKYPIESNGIITGTVVHDYLVLYMNKLKDGSIVHEKMDWRALRPLWEQKKCMYDRIQAIEKENGWDNKISEEYASVVEKANHIRIMYALHHKKPKISILDMIANELIKIKDREKELLVKLIDRMEGK